MGGCGVMEARVGVTLGMWAVRGGRAGDGVMADVSRHFSIISRHFSPTTPAQTTIDPKTTMTMDQHRPAWTWPMAASFYHRNLAVYDNL